MRTACAAFLIVVVASVCLAQTRTRRSTPAHRRSPAATASDFYRTYLKLKVRGLPDEKQWKELSPFFTDDVMKQFETARQTHDKFVREHPDEKPPWGDGDLFTSLFEGAHTFTVGKPTTTGDRVEVPVNLSYTSDGATTKWTDVMVLTQTPGGWRISDILLKGEWQFKNGDSLRGILKPE